MQVAAVMGPSGAGKTTFLNALMGNVKYGTISGQVWVNRRAMKMSRLRRIMGFVPQVHFCTPVLAVIETKGLLYQEKILLQSLRILDAALPVLQPRDII